MPALRLIRSHTALRGVAAIMVVLYHLQVGSGTRLAIEDATPFFRRAYLCVDLFFVLSGFILSYVSDAGGETYRSRADVTRFFRSRFARLYPLHICCLVGFVVGDLALTLVTQATGRLPPVDWSAGSLAILLSQALLLNAWIPDSGGWNVPTWSISAEAVAYLIFPLLVNWRAVHPRLAATAILLVALAFFGSIGATTGTLDVIGGPIAILRCIAGFFTGMLTYQWRNVFARSRDGNLSVLQVIAVVGLLVVLATGTSDPLAIPFFVLLVGATWQDRGLMPRLLDRAPMRWLGDVSYSVYLLHVPVISLLTFGWSRLIENRGLDPAIERSAWLVTVLTAVLGLAGITYRRIERPTRAWLGRRLLGRAMAPITTSPAAP